jgi:hypothetical protein
VNRDEWKPEMEHSAQRVAGCMRLANSEAAIVSEGQRRLCWVCPERQLEAQALAQSLGSVRDRAVRGLDVPEQPGACGPERLARGLKRGNPGT